MGLAKLDKSVQEAARVPWGKHNTTASTAASKDGASWQDPPFSSSL